MKQISAIVLILFFIPVAAAQYDIYPLSKTKQIQFQNLLKELRCLVCQNQDLADSNADLAKDLKREVYKQVEQGKSNQQIIEYLTSRYGDFILFKPPLQSNTLVLWLGPFAFLLVGLFVFGAFIYSKRASNHD